VLIIARLVRGVWKASLHEQVVPHDVPGKFRADERIGCLFQNRRSVGSVLGSSDSNVCDRLAEPSFLSIASVEVDHSDVAEASP